MHNYFGIVPDEGGQVAAMRRRRHFRRNRGNSQWSRWYLILDRVDIWPRRDDEIDAYLRRRTQFTDLELTATSSLKRQFHQGRRVTDLIALSFTIIRRAAHQYFSSANELPDDDVFFALKFTRNFSAISKFAIAARRSIGRLCAPDRPWWIVRNTGRISREINNRLSHETTHWRVIN